MKEVSILLLAALLLNGCSSTSTTVQTPVGNGWQAAMSGGDGTSSGFSFNTFFTAGSGGALSISSTQLLNSDTCFGTSNIVSGGTLNVTVNAAFQVSGTFSFTLTSSAGDVITLSSNDVTGTVNSTTNVLSNGSIIGTWALAPASGSACLAANGSFTMTQSAS